MRRWAWGLSGRLVASYIVVTLAVVVLVEALVLGFQVPQLVNGAQLQAQVDATARSYAGQLSQRYRGGVPAGTVLGVPGQPAWPGWARTARWSFRRFPARSTATLRSPRSWRSPPTARSSRPPRHPGTRPDA